MRKLSCFLLAALTLLGGRAHADDMVLSLSGDIIAEKATKQEKAKAEEPKTEDNSALEKAINEDRGVFSFMNVFNKKTVEAPAKTDTPLAPEETPLEKLISTAKAGDLNSQMSLGYMYLYGQDGVDIDYKQAFEYYQMAAAQKDNVAINNLGSLYFSGIGTARNPETAAKMFANAAENGNVEAALNLAFLYMSGQGVERNYRHAIKMFSQASEAGNPTASFMLGYAYFKGFIVKQDLRRAYDLIRQGANAGYDDAQYVLSSMYVNGWGVPQNYAKAVNALNNAVAQGYVPAMIDLGNMLVIGDKYPADIYTAHIMFNVASVLGAPGAADMRDSLKKNLEIEALLQAQAEAGRYKENPSELTTYIKNTFGENIKGYIDDGLAEQAKRTSTKKK